MKVGDQIALWDTQYASGAYADQFGIMHNGYIVTKEYIVTVIEEKMVPGYYDKAKTGKGFRAVCSNGRDFTCGWRNYDECLTSPYWIWDATEDKDGYIWQPINAVIELNRSAYPCVRRGGWAAIPNIVRRCEFHAKPFKPYHYYYADQECLYCKFSREQRERNGS